jgi:hypothetical protein
MKYLILLIVVLTLLNQSSFCTETIDEPTQLWKDLLKAFERHDNDSKSFLQKVSTQKENVLESKLAHVLLEDWVLTADSDTLNNPKAVRLKTPERNAFPKGKIPGGVIPIELKVDSQGIVKSAKLIHSESESEVTDIILRDIKTSMFRPAFQNGKFVEKNAIITVRIEVK